MPSCSSIFFKASPNSWSILARRRSAYSIIVTSHPNLLNMDAISTPITPPPIITILSGFSCKDNASVELMIRFLSMVTPGTVAGLEPVAMINFFAPRDSRSPADVAISTVELLRKEAVPWITVTLFFFIRKFSPCVFCNTTLSLRAYSRSKSTDSPATWIPCAAKWCCASS